MGATCAQTSCGQAFMEWKALKELNKQGVYPPNQINDEVEKAFKSIVGKDSTFANKEQAKQICERVVNDLGSRGNGITFDDSKF